MADVTLNCGFGCSSVDGCQGHCEKPAPGLSDYRLGLERAAHECEWMARGYAAYLMQPLLDAAKRIRELPDNPADEPHCRRRDGQVPTTPEANS